VAIIKRSELLKYRASTNIELLTSLDVASAQKLGSKRPLVFISHSSKDKLLVDSVREILYNHGADSYVDREDSEMPEKVSSQTAKRLQEKMLICDKFVMIASNNALKSRWVPWELGFADNSTGTSNVGIFLVEEDIDENNEHTGEWWEKNEYVRLYKIIYRREGPSETSWLVGYPEGFVLLQDDLRNWLHKP
jgi:hypothetical protein